MIVRSYTGKGPGSLRGAAARADVPARTLEEELLHLLARQARRVPIPVFLVAAVIAGMAMRHVSSPVWPLAWLGLVAFVLFLRWHVLGRLPAMGWMSAEKRLRLAVLLSGVNGVTHGLSLFFFWQFAEFERAVQSMLLIGLCAGSVSTTAGYRPVFLAYILPTLLPLAILWGKGTVETSSWVEGAATLLFVFLGAVLFLLAQDAFGLLKESFEIRQAKTRVLAAASHDLRQPLHELSLLTSALSVGPTDQPAETVQHMNTELVQHINTALGTLRAGFDGFLDVYKYDVGVVRPVRQTVDIGAIVERVAATLSAAARQKHLELAAEYSPDLYANTDPMLFERVVRNLVDNAIKYTPAGRVTLQARAAGDCIEVAVADTGPGIPEDKQLEIFEEFVQLDNAERQGATGLGLGLSIVKRHVELLDMGLELISAPGAGAKFVLTLERTHIVAKTATARAVEPGNEVARMT